MNWNKRTVLVTGAGGFIGSHLIEKLVQLGAETRALVRYNSTGNIGWLETSSIKGSVEVIQGDIRDADIVRRISRGVDMIFHLAALIGIPYSYQAPLSYLRTNVEGTLNILQAGIENDVCRIILTSTSEVYGTTHQVPISEEHPLRGQSPYSASKIAADKFGESFNLSFGLPVTTVRPFNTFGPRQSARAVIPTIITQALRGDVVRLGSLRPTRDFTYVTDTVEGFVSAATAENAVGQVINIGSGREISVGELAALIFKLVGHEAKIVVEPRRLRPDESEVERLLADNRRAEILLTWRPQHTLEEGLALTIDWIRSNIEAYRAETYAI
jgi:NAD dependent epimerase/dehydratase